MEINITVLTNGVTGAMVHPDPATIDKNNEAVWKCNDNFTVTFGHGSPFQGKNFDKKNNKSGKPKQSETGHNKEFKYTVKVGDTTIDPRVIIP